MSRKLRNRRDNYTVNITVYTQARRRKMRASYVIAPQAHVARSPPLPQPTGTSAAAPISILGFGGIFSNSYTIRPSESTSGVPSNFTSTGTMYPSAESLAWYSSVISRYGLIYSAVTAPLFCRITSPMMAQRTLSRVISLMSPSPNTKEKTDCRPPTSSRCVSYGAYDTYVYGVYLGSKTSETRVIELPARAAN